MDAKPGFSQRYKKILHYDAKPCLTSAQVNHICTSKPEIEAHIFENGSTRNWVAV
jgi:hypothetical protein